MKRIITTIKKNSKVFILLGILLISGTVAYGASAVLEAAVRADLTDNVRIETNINQKSDAIQAQADRIQKIESGLKKDKQILSEEEYMMLYAYVELLMKYQPTEQELSEIDNLISAGNNVFDVVNVFVFWRTTDCGIDTMGQVLQMKDTLTGRNWIENAYNIITQNRYGVLDRTAYEEYISRGATMADIDYANILCRKGIYTIQEILDEKVSGKTWEQIVSQMDGSKKLFSAFQLSEKKVTSASKMMLCDALTQQFGEDENKLLKAKNETLEEIAVQYDTLLSQKVEAFIADLGITYIPEPREEDEAVIRSVNQHVLNNGISQEKIDQLRSQGYDDIEIINASERCKNNDAAMDTVLNEYKQTGRWDTAIGGDLK